MSKKDDPLSLVDPLDVNVRLYRQVARLLTDLEAGDTEDKITIPQRINALLAIGRVQVIFSNLRRASADDPDRQGSSVRKYAQAFKTHATRRGTGGPRPAYTDDAADEPGDEPGDDAA